MSIGTMQEVIKIDLYTYYHNMSIRNKDMIMKGNNVGCFYCCSIYSKDIITNWIDNNDTATCPNCYIDSVISQSQVEGINFLDFLKKMRIKWF